MKILADSLFKTPLRLYSTLNITKIIQSLKLTDTITDDIYSNVHLASSTVANHADVGSRILMRISM